MKKLIVVFLLLCSAYSWGGEKKSVKDEARKEAVEDICFAYAEYSDAHNAFLNAKSKQEYSSMSAGFRPGSQLGRLNEVSNTKQRRMMTLQDRYVKRFGSEFAVFPPQSSSGPSLCR